MEFSLGILGVLLILIGWVPETMRALREWRAIDPKFASLYALGSLLLAVHAYNIGDFAFIVLNIAAFLIALLNLYIGMREKR